MILQTSLMEPLDLIISVKNQDTKSIEKAKQIYYVLIIKFLKRKSRKQILFTISSKFT